MFIDCYDVHPDMAAFEAGKGSWEVPLFPPPFADGKRLTARFLDPESGDIWLVRSDARAFRVLDEGGLIELWGETAAQGGRPGMSTFGVTGHAWSEESFIEFQFGDGWSYVVATSDDCLEIVAADPPDVSRLTTLRPTAT